MLNIQPSKRKTTISKTVTTWDTPGSITKNASKVEPVKEVRSEKKLIVDTNTRPIIENCLLNGVIQPGAKISFPLYLYQQTGIQSMLNKNIILADTSSGEDFEVKLLRLYTRDEWSNLMRVGNMAPVFIGSRKDKMEHGCQIDVIKRI